MNYPTLDQVEKADHYQICEWYRFLPAPGFRAIALEEVLKSERTTMNRIVERFKELDGFTPGISKSLGF